MVVSKVENHIWDESHPYLGWVLSGPKKGFPDDSKMIHVIPCDDHELEDSMQKLWNLETLGNREENEIYIHSTG